MRTLGLRRAAERDLASASPEIRALMQAYADGKADAVCHVAAAESDPNGQPLRKVVDGYGYDKEPDPPHLAGWTLKSQGEMLVGQNPVDKVKAQGPQEYPHRNRIDAVAGP